MSRRAAADLLALYATCGDLVVAFVASEVAHVYAADDVGATRRPSGVAALTFGTEKLAAWDLAELLGLRRPSSCSTYVVLVDAQQRRFAVGCDRTLIVAPNRVALSLSPSMFVARAGAIVGVFRTQMLDDPELAPTGILLSAPNLLAPQDITTLSAMAARGELRW